MNLWDTNESKREREMGEYTESKQINDLRQSSYHVIKQLNNENSNG